MDRPNAYHLDDIASVLTAVTVAAVQASTASGANCEYLRGVLHHSRAMAISFGVPWAQVEGELRSSGDSDLIEKVCALPGGGM